MRAHRNLTQTLLAHEVEAVTGIHLDRMAVSRIEAGTRTVSLAEAVALATALRVPLADLVSPRPLAVIDHTTLDGGRTG